MRGELMVSITRDAAAVRSLPDLAGVLRQLRRREARGREGTKLTYRELAAKSGWSHAIIGEYLTGTALAPTDRFDTLIHLLGATAAEMGALATARDRVEELRHPARARAGGHPGPRPHAVPRELPASVAGFVGRQREFGELDRLAVAGDGSLVVAVISGSGGVGKTTVAVHWAHQRAGQFPDGQLYVDLRGFAPTDPIDAGDALARFLHALGVDAARMPAGTDERAAQYRTMLAGRRMLVVLDNALSAEQVRPLLPGSPMCMVVVTSRDSLPGLVAMEGATRIDLDVLAPPEAVGLLGLLLGQQVEDAPEDAQALARQCAWLPLALRVAAELAAARPDASLADLVADLRDQRVRLDLLDAGDQRSAMRSVMSWSYRRLSPDAARLFRLLGCDPGPDLSVWAVASLAGVTPAVAHALVAELARAHMLAEAGPGRYTVHDMLRAYAAELAGTREAAPDRRAAVSRLLDHYLHTAVRADRLLDPTRVRVDVTAAGDGVTVTPLDSSAAAQTWFDAEQAALLAAAPLARDHGFVEHAWQLPWAMANLLEREPA